MNALNVQSTELVKECSREHPSLKKVEEICGISFQTFGTIGTLLPLFNDTDTESTKEARATWLAYHWLRQETYKDTTGGGLFNQEVELDFRTSQNQFDIEARIILLHTFHKMQLRRDPRFMNHLRNEYAKFRKRFAAGY